MVGRAPAPALGPPPSRRPRLAPPPACHLSWLGHTTGVQGFSIHSSARAPPVPRQDGKTLLLHLQVGASVFTATNKWRVCVCFLRQGGLGEPPRHPHAAPGPSEPFSGSPQAACLSGLLLAQHTEPGRALHGGPGGSQGRRRWAKAGLSAAQALSCPPPEQVLSSLLLQREGPWGVTSLPPFSPEEDLPSHPSSAYSGARHPTLFTTISEEPEVRVMGSGNLP